MARCCQNLLLFTSKRLFVKCVFITICLLTHLYNSQPSRHSDSVIICIGTGLVSRMSGLALKHILELRPTAFSLDLASSFINLFCVEWNFSLPTHFHPVSIACSYSGFRIPGKISWGIMGGKVMGFITNSHLCPWNGRFVLAPRNHFDRVNQRADILTHAQLTASRLTGHELLMDSLAKWQQINVLPWHPAACHIPAVQRMIFNLQTLAKPSPSLHHCAGAWMSFNVGWMPYRPTYKHRLLSHSTTN